MIDPHAAELLGLSLGQITLQYHGGGGSLPGELGLLFGRRKRKPARQVRVQMAVQRPLYHFGSARSAGDMRRRRSLYFSAGAPPIERNTPEGERLALANAMAMNYGFAFRLSSYASLRSLLGTCFGAGSRLVVDTVHNSIYDEQINDEQAVVHRHNACRIFPAATMRHHPVFGQTGQPLLVPGTNRTSSYLCIPGEHADRAMYTACHGAGTVVGDFARSGASTLDPHGHTTLRFDCRSGHAETVPHLDDHGVDTVVGVLRDHGIAQPVVRLRPFAVQN